MGYELDEDAIPDWMKKTTVDRQTAGSKSVLTCNGCGHDWVNRVPEPQKCPGCGAQIKWEDEETAGDSDETSETDDFEDLFGE